MASGSAASAPRAPPPRPPLPFGLGSPLSCSSARCLCPSKPLPKPGSPLHDDVAVALSRLFSTFYATSLRYLGVSEVLDWLETNRTVDLWIVSGLEQGRSPQDIASAANLQVGRDAIQSVIKAALEQDDQAWATSLREVGFSSGMSMAYEGIVSQLKPTQSSPLPCLHSLLTPAGLQMLRSAPLKHAFPICPPRPSPSPAPLLASLRTLIAAPGSSLSHLQSTSYRQPIRKAFAAYNALVLSIAEDLIADPSFSTQYSIFLTSISQPLQLLQLIADDFEEEFGPGACRGLLGVGDVGGRNLNQVMSFCRSGRPSELLERVRARVRERKQAELEGRPLPPLTNPSAPPPTIPNAPGKGVRRDAPAFIQGSSKDLLPSDPFASTAPRAELSNGRANGKGKGRAMPPPARYMPSKPPSKPPSIRRTPPPTPPPRGPRPPAPSSGSECSCECSWDDEEDDDDDSSCCPDCAAAGRA